MNRHLAAAACSALMLVSVAPPAQPASLEIHPVRITLGSSKPTAEISIRNQAQQGANIQVESMAWERVDGRDVYQITRDLLVNPPLFTVAAGASQIVRIGLNRPADTLRELSYRIYLREVPSSLNPQFSGLQVALRIGLPLFVLPSTTATRSELHWRLQRQRDGTLDVTATNHGNAHSKVTEIRMADSADARHVASLTQAAYVFPGETRTWSLTPEQAWRGARARVSVSTDHGDAETEIGVD